MDQHEKNRTEDLINSLNCIIIAFMKNCKCMCKDDKLIKDVWLEDEVQTTLRTIIKSKLSK